MSTLKKNSSETIFGQGKNVRKEKNHYSVDEETICFYVVNVKSGSVMSKTSIIKGMIL